MVKKLPSMMVVLLLTWHKGGANEYGKTHYVKINDFKPEAQEEQGSKNVNDLPF